MQPKKRSMMLWTLTGLCLILSCSGCASGSSGIKAACAVFQPITYSSRDTPETVAQIELHDVRWMRLCR